MAFGTPPAYMGFVGFVRFEFPGENLVVRATSADIRLSQDITKPDVIDGRFDRSLYQLGPKIVEGSVEYPAIMERADGNLDPAARLYIACVGRETVGDRFGQLKNTNLFDLGVRYTSQFAEFRYKSCLVNQWKFSAAQSDTVKINCDLIGRERERTAIGSMTAGSEGFPQNSRIVTWNDVIVNVIGGSGAPNISGEYIRNFECTINNNAERYYSFNGLLFPQDIAVRKRDIDGSLTLLGRHEQLGEHAASNQERCSEGSQVRFGYNLTSDLCDATFLVTLPNIVFRIEELALTNDLFETTVQWHSFPDDLDLSTSDYLVTAGAVA
jgi:hypothetical protein